MLRSSVVLGLLSVVLVSGTGCESGDPLSPVSASRATVRILGPSSITESGVYSWEAVVDGDAGAMEFVWEIVRPGSEESALSMTGRVISLQVDVKKGPLALRLSVRNGEVLYNAGYVVTMCGAPPLHDERLIDDCTRL